MWNTKYILKIITDMQAQAGRQEIVQAMGMGRGAWYACPNGHVYAIGVSPTRVTMT